MPGFYIPPRVYNKLKCIYNERITIVSAPDGYGKSGTVRKFVQRSRPDNFSCRFIDHADNANDCFNSISRIILGKDAAMPITESEFQIISRRFGSARSKKELLIVLDCPEATEMLLSNLFCTKLFLHYSYAHIVLVTNELSFLHQSLAQINDITIIPKTELALNAEETRQFLIGINLTDCDSEEMRRNTCGEIARLSFCGMLMKRGEEVRSYDLQELIKQAIIDKLNPSRTFAAICVASFSKIDEKVLETMRSEPEICDYFGTDSITKAALIEGTRYISSILPLVRLNRRSNHWSARPFFKQAAYQRFLELPPPVQIAFHNCIAKEYVREKKTFRAFCHYYLTGNIYAAATSGLIENISFDLLMRTKDFLLYFVQSCPLDCKPMIPRLLRILSLLMLTPHRNKVKYRFAEIISYVSSSPSYSGAEQRNLLCYAYALRTYEDFYIIEKMGNHIKRAYDLYSGSSIGTAPFYSWGLYTPSIFSLIHHYNLSIANETELFARYHSMYTEMVHHGEFVLDIYNAEAYYYVGDIKAALASAQEIIPRCKRDLYLPARISTINLVGKCSLMLGYYDLFAECTDTLSQVIRKYSSTELGEMAALSLAQLSCIRNGSEEEIWRVTSTSDEDIMLNRYAAPFYFYVRCFAMLSHREYNMLLRKVSFYLEAATDVRSETIALSIKLAAAIAHTAVGETEAATELMDSVLTILTESEIIMPAIELCMLYPHIFEQGREWLPQHEAFLNQVLNTSKQYRRNMIAVRTRELTEIGQHESNKDFLLASLNTNMTALELRRKELGLTKNAMKYALLASMQLSNEVIADTCDTTVNSVKSSLKRTFAALGISSRGQLKYIFKLRE